MLSIAKGENLIKKLFKAVEEDNLKEIHKLLNAGAFPNAIDHTGRSPLHYAAIKGKEELISLLIEAGANIEQGVVEFTDFGPEMSEYTAVAQAAWHHQYNVLEKLAIYGANIEVMDVYGNSLLINAIRFGHNILAEKLINLGANINAINLEGDTPLHIAVARANRTITQILIEKNADIVPNCQNLTPLDLGAKNGIDLFILQIRKNMVINRTNIILNNIFNQNNKNHTLFLSNSKNKKDCRQRQKKTISTNTKENLPPQ